VAERVGAQALSLGRGPNASPTGSGQFGDEGNGLATSGSARISPATRCAAEISLVDLIAAAVGVSRNRMSPSGARRKVVHTLADMHRMVAEALVEPSDERDL
jgi:hypothetical protein